MAESSSEFQSKTDYIHKCNECKMKFTDKDLYTEHLQSKEHKKEKMKEKYGKKYLEAKAKLEEKIGNGGTSTFAEKYNLNSENSVSESSDDDSEGEVYTCEVCSKVCTGYMSYKTHLSGQKHHKKLKNAKVLKQLQDNNLISKLTEKKTSEEPSLLDRIMTKVQYASSSIKCETCNVSCSGPQCYQQHCKSDKHLKKLAMQGLSEGMKSESTYTKGIDDDSEFHCDVCQKHFSGPLPYQQHMESVVHMRQERNVEELSKIKDLVICSEEDSKLTCKECGKVFSGPIPFNDHLKSSAHAKLMKKNAQMKALEQEHPEMVKKIPMTEDSDNEEESTLLTCPVCHVSCTGPQSARDHFESAKHKKAVKTKSLRKKYAKLPDGKKQGKVPTAELSSKATKSEENGSPKFDDEFEILQKI